jgi:hypothetical protein
MKVQRVTAASKKMTVFWNVLPHSLMKVYGFTDISKTLAASTYRAIALPPSSGLKSRCWEVEGLTQGWRNERLIFLDPYINQPWRWKQHVSPKRFRPLTSLHGAKPQIINEKVAWRKRKYSRCCSFLTVKCYHMLLQRPSWVANSCQPGHEISRFLRNPHNRFLSQVFIRLYTSQTKPMYSLISYFPKIHFNSILSSTFRCFTWSLNVRFPEKKLCTHLFLSSCFGHVILLDFITLKRTGDEYKLWNS